MLRNAAASSAFVIALCVGAGFASHGCMYGAGDEPLTQELAGTPSTANDLRSTASGPTVAAHATNASRGIARVTLPISANVPDVFEPVRRAPPVADECNPECPPGVQDVMGDPARRAQSRSIESQSLTIPPELTHAVRRMPSIRPDCFPECPPGMAGSPGDPEPAMTTPSGTVPAAIVQAAQVMPTIRPECFPECPPDFSNGASDPAPLATMH